ncbi:MAG: zinc ribbon domain-containing protein [Dehalococcoidia bacterium]
MYQTYQCLNCGSSNAAGTRYCRTCGQEFQYRCLRCESEIDPTFKFCPDCGLKLSWPEPQQQQQQQPQPLYSTHYTDYQQQYSGYERGTLSRKSGRMSPLWFLGLVAGLALIITGVVLTIHRASLPDTSVTLPGQESVQEKNSYIAGNLEIPEYVQQHTNTQPPYGKSSGEQVNLVNNDDARDVSFAELKSFILSDDTDDGVYIEGVQMCGEFAETLHNNAERHGINAAFVAIHFENEDVGHALNAFNTTDLGLVYIDCTGRGIEETVVDDWSSGEPYTCEYDSIAYIEKGNEYGVVSIDKAESLYYDYYVAYSQDCAELSELMDVYNSDVEAYNEALGGRKKLAEPEYSQFMAWADELEGMKAELEEMFDRIGYCWAEPLGIVTTVDIYW